jgi:hypothetical protein
MAIVQLANSDSKGEACDQVVDEILRATHVIPENHWSRSFAFAPNRRAVLQAASAIPTSTPTAITNVDLSQMVGAYQDAAYGEYFLCSPLVSQDNITHGCKEVLDAFSTLENVTALANRKLYGYMRRTTLLAEHVTLKLLSNDGDSGSSKSSKNVTFEMNWTNVYPKGYGADTSPYESSLTQGAGFHAVFQYEDEKIRGFGVFGLAGQVLERERRGGSVQEKAEVWFARDNGDAF